MDNLEYKGYLGSVEYSKADKCLYGKVLGMAKDSITYEGYTIDELEADFKTAIESYIEGCNELGIKPRKTYNGILNIRISSDIHRKIALLAERSGISINTFIRKAIEHEVKL
jgi:predicted HicB family RNase H-like nuclease